MLEDRTVGVLGAGNMGEALIAGLVRAHILPKDRILASRRSEVALAYLTDTYGIRVTTDNRRLVQESDVVVLAIKPQAMPQVLDECASCFREGQLVISIAAGITTRYLESRIPASVAVVRVMPNTPALVGEAISPYCLGKLSGATQALLASEIFSAVGVTVEVREEWMDAITALSGTGPAYLFFLLEGLIDAGLEMGLPEHLVRALVRQTAYGAAKLLRETMRTPQQLRAQVTSPQGTTHAALTFLKDESFLETFKQAVFAAMRRSEELGLVD